MIVLPLILAALRLWTPLAFSALGGVVSERAGVVALALEGMMLAGAFAAVAGTEATGTPFAGVAIGILAGGLVGLLHAFTCLTLRVSHVLSGVALNLGTVGLTTFLVRLRPEGWSVRQTIPADGLAFVAVLLTALVWFLMTQTVPGLRLRACGENPAAALSAGLAVGKLRYGAVFVSGMLAGLGGVALSLGGLGAFTENMTAGRGYIALAAVIFGRWNAVGAALAALLFGFGDALQLSLQTAGLAKIIPPDLLGLLPYALTLLILALRSGRTDAPASLGTG